MKKLKSDLSKRISTSVFLVIGAVAWMFIGAVYLSQTFGERPEWAAYTFMIINTLFLCIAIYEIIKLRTQFKWSIWIKALIFIMAVIFLWMPLGNETFGFYSFNSKWFKFWMTLLVYIFFIGLFIVIKFSFKKLTGSDLVFIFFWTFYFTFVFKGVNFLMLEQQGVRHGWPTFVYIWVIVISSDVGGYVGGSLWGKKQLAPQISPKKTWEGAITGYVCSFVLSMITVVILLETSDMKLSPLPINDGPYGRLPVYIAYFGFSFLLSFVSPMGDLLFSYLKRNHNVKDFSNIFPGHGGFLDRLDGFSLVVLVTYFVSFLMLTGIY